MNYFNIDLLCHSGQVIERLKVYGSGRKLYSHHALYLGK